MDATGKYDYEGTASDELSFRKGQQLKILKTTGNWYKAELNGDKGFVPKNFINIHLPSWYQEDCSQSDAEERLISQCVGAFIVRGSQSSALAEFSISVRHLADVQHFKVLRNSRGQYYLWTEKFPSINQLVEYYKRNFISYQAKICLKETQQQQKEALDSKPPLPAPQPPDRKPPLPAPQPPDCSPVPAPRQRKPSPTLQVRALYGFYAEEADELDFDAGDIISVLDYSDESWWRGELRGKRGLFPSNYTEPL